MLKPRPSLSSQPKPKLLSNHSFGFYRRALGPQEVAEQLERELQGDTVFQWLVQAQVIRPIRLLGAIPPEQYDTYHVSEAVRFVQEHRLEEQSEWKQALRSPHLDANVAHWAKKWGVEEGDLRRALRRLRAEPAGRDASLWVDAVCQAEVTARPRTDESEVLGLALEFVKRHQISQQEFVDYILSGEYGPDRIAERYGSSLAEADALWDAVLRMNIQETFGAAAAAGSNPSAALPSEGAAQVIAEARVSSTGELQLRLLSQRLCARYRVDRARLEAWLQAHGCREECEAVLERVWAINQRSGALTEMVYTICLEQREFIASGDECDLRPLQQAEVARRCGYHRSVVGRLIRWQQVITPHGRYPLAALMPRHREVVQRLAQAHPDWRAKRIADWLRLHYGLPLTERAVRYHLQQAQEVSGDPVRADSG